MGDENSLAGTTKAHKHSAVSTDGGFLETSVTGVTNLSEGSIVYGNASEIVTELTPGVDGTSLKIASGVPAWEAGSAGLQLIRSRLPMENIESVSVDDLFRIGDKDWKVTQTAKPILFEGNDDADLSAMSDDMTGYANDTEFDAVWVTSDGTNLNPDASTDRINGIIADSSDASCYFDIGHTLQNDSVFTLIFTMQVTASGAGNKKWFMGLSDSTADFTTNQDAVGFHVGNDNLIIQCGAVNNTTLDQVSATDGNFATLADSTNRYFVFNGLGFGRFSCTMYSTDALGKNYETETQTFTWSSAPSNLRYIKIALWSKVNGTSVTFNISKVMFAESDHPMLIFNK